MCDRMDSIGIVIQPDEPTLLGLGFNKDSG